MTRTDFYFDSRDNVTQIHAVKWVPDTEPVGVLVIVHGMAETIDRYEPFAQYMCDRGFVVAGNEHLGHGKSVGKNPKGYFCRRDPATVVVRDVHRLKKQIQSEYPSLPIFIFGHSMGSLITRNYLTRYGSGINGVVISIETLAKGLREKGHNVYIFSPSDPKLKNMPSDDPESEEYAIRLPSVPVVFSPEHRLAIRHYRKVYKLVKSLELDIIHTNSEFTMGILGEVCGHKLGIPVIHTYHTM